MSFAITSRPFYRWPLQNTCDLIVSIALAVLAACFLHGPIELPLATWIGHILQTRIPTSDSGQVSKIGGIIVLGGSVERVGAAIEIAETFPDLPVVLSGPSEIEIQHAFALLGHASARLIVDRRPTSTYTNALHARDYMLADPSACWILVTSAIHMPRAVGSFQALSLSIAPWLVYHSPSDPKSLSHSVGHEIIGLVAYRLLGMSDAFLPRLSPQSCLR